MGQPGGTAEIGLHLLGDASSGGLLHRILPRPARVGDDDGGGAVFQDGTGGQRRGGGIAQIKGVAFGDMGGGQVGPVDITGDDGRPKGGKARRQDRTDAATCTGHDNPGTVKPDHGMHLDFGSVAGRIQPSFEGVEP